MAEGGINICCDDAMRQAALLRVYSDNLMHAISQYAQIVGELACNWEGNSSEVFISRAEDRMSQMRKAAVRLYELANAINKTVRLYRESELAKPSPSRQR